MKLQNLALGLALAVAGSAFAATTHETTVTRETPNGTVTKHIVRTNERQDVYHGHRHTARKVVVVHHPQRHHVKKVVIVHPERRDHVAVNRTVVVHPEHREHVSNRTVVVHRDM
jgi:hypothetical protein